MTVAGTLAYCRRLDIVPEFAKHRAMSWFLSPSVRRIIGLFLLLLDLTLEPGSALSFTSTTDTDSDLVADLCTRENFSWTIATAVDEAISNTREVVCGPPLCEKRQSVACDNGKLGSRAVVSQDFDAVLPSAIPFEIVLSRYTAYPLSEHSAHSNTYLAHRRSIVLII